MTDLDPDDVRKFLRSLSWRTAESETEYERDRLERGEFLGPEIRLYLSERPRQLERERREVERREEEARLWARAEASRKAAEAHAWRMADMRKWGPENGYFVGARGRIPRRVIEAYNKAKGVQ